MTEEPEGLVARASSMLSDAGWDVTEDSIRATLAPATRGGSLVVVRPPSPAWAVPALSGILARCQEQQQRLLVLCAPAMVSPMGQTIALHAQSTNLRVLVATGTARSARRLAAGEVDVLVCSPTTALGLHSRSTLQPDQFGAVAIAWPEDWDADEALTVLLGDLPKDSQRLVLTSNAAKVESLIERYARKALVVTSRLMVAPDAVPIEPKLVRSMPTPWGGRIQAVLNFIETADPPALTVWTADDSDHEAIRRAVADPAAVRLVSRQTDVSGMVVCYDLPDGPTLTVLSTGRDVTLLVCPGTEAFVQRLAPTRRPVHAPGALAALLDRDGALRSRIAGLIVAGNLDGALYQLGPMFEQYDPQLIAAACLALGRTGPGARPEPAPPVTATTPVGGVANAKVWVGVGRRDEATTGDLVAVLIKEVGLAREAIGRIELRDAFTLVEVPVGDAERVAQSLTGLTIRRRKLSARVDRGIPERPSGGAGRSGGARPTGRSGGSRPTGSRPPR